MSAYHLQLAHLAAVNALLATAVYLPLAAGRLVVCFGALMASGAVAFGWAQAHAAPAVLALACGAGAGTLLAGAVGLLLRQVRGLTFAVATLSVGEVLRIVVTNTPSLGGALGYTLERIRPLDAAPLAALAAVAGCMAWLEATSIRKAIFQVRSDPRLARSLGISVERHELAALTMGGAIAGLAGGLFVGSVGIVEPRVWGFQFSVQILMFAVVGGSTHFGGAVMAAVVLTLVPEALRFSSSYRMILYGIVLVAVTILRPEGLLSRRPRLRMGRPAKGISV
ncbi:MAG TPA: branched-chain amino acid ABC transporter permease [Longimicrobium sp.]|nr:branched-chain amino acid ABC transporter permease [Longimicrobium sp.]